MNARGLFRRWTLVAALALAGCSDLGSPLKLLPRIELSTGSLDFGTLVVGDSATRSVVVRNSGSADLHGSAAVSCAGYSIASGGGAFTVPPAGQHSVVVRYRPSGVGSSPCELSLGNGLPPVTLSGAGALQAPGAVCTTSVRSLDFGTFNFPADTLGQFKLFSVGTAPVILNVVAAGCSGFSVVVNGGARTLAPGDSLTVTLRFAPVDSGHFACTIVTGPGCPDVAVTGDVTRAPVAAVSFAAQILPIFNARGCNGCHLFQQTSDIVNVPAPGYGTAVRIAPSDVAGSVLYGKVAGTRQYGQNMPLGATSLIPLAERTLIKTWILEGAHNN